MNNRVIIIFFISILISGLLYSQTVEKAPWSNCSDIPDNNLENIERWLNKKMNEAKEAVKNGRWYDNGNHKLPPCKIKEIESLYKNLVFEYDCECGECALGGKNHHLKRRPFIRICQPLDMYLNQEKNLNKPSSKLCGCIEGKIVHELTHAAGDDTEEGAVDCSKILYPCALDPFGDATNDHRNCTCCGQEGK